MSSSTSGIAIPDVDEWEKMTLLGREREMLGLYVSDHPLGLEHVLSPGHRLHDRPADARREPARRRTITVSGLVTSVQRKITKRGDAWAMVTVEDLDGAIDVLLFPSAWQLCGQVVNDDAIITVRGPARGQKDQPEIHGQEVSVPDLSDGPSGPSSSACRPPAHPAGRRAARGARHPPGMTEVRLRLLTREQTMVMRLDDRPASRRAPQLFADLGTCWGPDA